MKFYIDKTSITQRKKERTGALFSFDLLNVTTKK